MLSVNAGEGIGYVMPAILHPANASGNVEFFFRVKGLYDKAELVMRSGNRVIRKMPKTHLMPSVMERMLITQKEMQELTDDVVIECREEN